MTAMSIQGGAAPAAAEMDRAEINLHHQVEEQAADCDIIDWFEGIAKNARLVQIQTLKHILQLNRDTIYLRKWLGNDLN